MKVAGVEVMKSIKDEARGEKGIVTTPVI